MVARIQSDKAQKGQANIKHTKNLSVSIWGQEAKQGPEQPWATGSTKQMLVELNLMTFHLGTLHHKLSHPKGEMYNFLAHQKLKREIRKQRI